MGDQAGIAGASMGVDSRQVEVAGVGCTGARRAVGGVLQEAVGRTIAYCAWGAAACSTAACGTWMLQGR